MTRNVKNCLKRVLHRNDLEECNYTFYVPCLRHLSAKDLPRDTVWIDLNHIMPQAIEVYISSGANLLLAPIGINEIIRMRREQNLMN